MTKYYEKIRNIKKVHISGLLTILEFYVLKGLCPEIFDRFFP
jgi:hypothetical protein